MKQGVVYRTLGVVESAMAALHECAGSGQTTSALHFTGHVNVQRLENAAYCVAGRHPLLRAALVEDGDVLAFAVPRQSRCVEVRHVAIAEFEDWINCAQQEVNTPLDPVTGLWRITLIEAPRRTYVLLLTCHHAAVDGSSLVTILSDLITSYESLASPSSSERGVSLHGGCVPPPLESMLYPRRGAYRQLSCSAERPVHQVPHRCSAALEQRQSENQYQILEESQLADLFAVSQKYQLTLNSLIGGALLAAACQVGLGAHLQISSAVSLRGRAPIPIQDRTVGCYINVAETVVDATGPLHAVARRYQQLLSARIPSSLYQSTETLLTAHRAKAAALANGAAFTGGLGFTNHGRIELPRTGSIVPTAYYNVACRRIGNFAVALHAATFNLRLHLAYTYSVPLIDPDTVSDIRRALSIGLQNLRPETAA